MDTSPIFLTTPAWHQLGDLLNANEALASRLFGIEPSPVYGVITETELLDRLGGERDVWPEWCIETMLTCAFETCENLV